MGANKMLNIESKLTRTLHLNELNHFLIIKVLLYSFKVRISKSGDTLILQLHIISSQSRIFHSTYTRSNAAAVITYLFIHEEK